MICDGFPWPFCFLICMGIPGWELWRERFSSLPFQSFSINGEFLVGIHMGFSIWFFVGFLILEFGLVLHLIFIDGSYVFSNSRWHI